MVTTMIYTSVVNRIGNLTLAAASDNSKMGNNDFAYKKTVLASTKHLKLNADIYTKESWTVKDIEDRTQFLIDQIIALFPYVQSTYKETKECANRHLPAWKTDTGKTGKIYRYRINIPQIHFQWIT